MKPDFYTKAVLTIIALALMGHLLKPEVMPEAAPAAGEGKFGHVQAHFAISGTFVPAFFDTKTGGFAVYNADGSAAKHYRLVEVGKPLQVLQKAQQK